MADNVAITAGAGVTIAADEVVDGTLGTVKVQYVKIMDGTLDGTNKVSVNTTGLAVDVGSSSPPVGAALDASITGTQVTAGTQKGQAVYLANPADGTLVSYANPDDVNVKQINGTTVLTGTGAVGTGSQRVAVGTDTATIAGSAPGTAGTASSNVLSVQGIASMTPVLVGGGVASLASASGNPVQIGLRAAVSATPPTAATDGQIIYALGTETGKTVIKPYAVKELEARGTVTSTDTAAHTILAAGSGSNKTYVTAVQIGRTDAGASALTVTFNDSASTVVVIPSGGATNIVFPTPLVTAAATAFQGTSGTGVTTLFMSAQGYYGL